MGWVLRITFFLILFCGAVPAQTWFQCYEGCDNETVQCVRYALDGGLVAGGEIQADQGRRVSVWLMKLSSTGETEWLKRYRDDEFPPIHRRPLAEFEATSDGGYILAGNNYIYRPNQKNPTISVWVMKLDACGDIEWQKSYSRNHFQFHTMSVTESYDHGFVVAGGNTVIKLDSRGGVQWMKYYEGFSNILDVLRVSQGGYVFSGDHHQSGGGVLIVRVDKGGKVLWAYRMDASFSEFSGSVLETSTGNIFWIGRSGYSNLPYTSVERNAYSHTYTPNEGYLWMTKFSSDGIRLWHKGLRSSEILYGQSIYEMRDEVFTIIGWRNVVQVNSEGEILRAIYTPKGLLSSSDISEDGRIAFAGKGAKRKYGSDSFVRRLCISQSVSFDKLLQSEAGFGFKDVSDTLLSEVPKCIESRPEIRGRDVNGRTIPTFAAAEEFRFQMEPCQEERIRVFWESHSRSGQGKEKIGIP